MSKKIFTKTLLPLSAVIAVGTGVSTLASCSKDNYTTITVSCTAVPHDEILKAANNIAHIYGYKIVTNVQTGYDTENPAVANGDADANFFQHHPYLEAYNTSAASDKQLASVLDVHLEPIALWQKDWNGEIFPSGKQLPNAPTIYIPNKPDDFPRYGAFLNSYGIVADGYSTTNPSSWTGGINVTGTLTINPTVVASMITQIYQQGEYCVINGNFALQAGIPTPKRVALEKTSGSATDNPYNNLIAVKKGNESTPKTLALVKSLQNSVIYDWINEKYNGAVIPCEDLLPSES